MTWTRDEPDRPGWYWRRGPLGPVELVELVEVVESRPFGNAVVLRTRMVVATSHPGLFTGPWHEWAGPLQPPG